MMLKGVWSDWRFWMPVNFWGKNGAG